MDIKKISPNLSVSPQISATDISVLKAAGFQSIINNRPDNEEDGQPSSADLKSVAAEAGMDYVHQPITPGQISDGDVADFAANMKGMKGPVLAFCRTGTRAINLWALSEAHSLSVDAILETAKDAGYNLDGLKARLTDMSGDTAQSRDELSRIDNAHTYDVVIVGGGAGGQAAAASLRARDKHLDIAIIEPRDVHYYQPGWTLVGGGVFSRNQTKRSMKSLIPSGVEWVRAAVAGFHPDSNSISLESGEHIRYRALVVAPGLKLDWDAVNGLRETLGKNGVTSNYRFDLASYTWDLVRNMKKGTAIFTQPPMPIKCAGAPQKAMYLSCDHWLRSNRLDDIDVSFHTAGGVLFGVPDYVPALEKYVEKYGADVCYNQNLVAIDGEKKVATFAVTGADGTVTKEDRSFDMIHVCPPQTALDFMKAAPITNDAGWVEVNNETLQHVRYGNIFGLGDGMSAPNAKTAAAVRKQAPVVAHNVISLLKGRESAAIYTGYGSCPLTVERGKVVLAEFAYGGTLEPTFPKWLLDGTRPSGLSWMLKEKLMPNLYFDLMLKGHEWLAKPEILTHKPLLHDVDSACDFEDKP
ncbi:hypothetical protein GCM10017044_09710 [Kordiimonas sediminis]|uniref:TIGR01244 family phosphatase n=1 Tax=Kordiimonas sediminis TaxID=1735581 RepID=A0A919ANL1_9PROT|nr:bifunctional protein tyrosine phosphatase family protein/NAD(P)/FAD-dependent oxidoreductase [Kordiimonas sediminis]GHF17393.1 hypothetical protein GCM10017044_09710 [Kordiimonas sediminis]